MRRHELDPLSFLFGLLFAAVGLAILGGDRSGGSVSLDWAGPAVAISLALLIVLAVHPHRSRLRNQEPGEATPVPAASLPPPP